MLYDLLMLLMLHVMLC